MATPSDQQYVVFRLGGEEYAFDITSVKEIREPEQVAKVHRSPEYIEGVMNLRGKLVTVIDLRRRLGLHVSEPSDLSKIIVVEEMDTPVGFLVDEVTEVVRVSGSDIESAPSYVSESLDSAYVRGIAKLGDRLITIVDPVRVLELSEEDDQSSGER
jgi:purine-binding chemotaxis protein CheW